MKKVLLTLTVVIIATLSSPFASAAFAKDKVTSDATICVCPDAKMKCMKKNGKMKMPKDHECESMDMTV